MSPRSESNRRPPPYQGGALPPELHGRFELRNMEFNRKPRSFQLEGEGFEPPKASANGFTVRPVWPLRYPSNCIGKSQRPESNWQPTDYKSVALPIELRWHLAQRRADFTLGVYVGQETVRTQTLLRRGPSNSQRKIPCHQNRRTAKKRVIRS